MTDENTITFTKEEVDKALWMAKTCLSNQRLDAERRAAGIYRILCETFNRDPGEDDRVLGRLVVLEETVAEQRRQIAELSNRLDRQGPGPHGRGSRFVGEIEGTGEG